MKTQLAKSLNCGTEKNTLARRFQQKTVMTLYVVLENQFHLPLIVGAENARCEEGVK